MCVSTVLAALANDGPYEVRMGNAFDWGKYMFIRSIAFAVIHLCQHMHITEIKYKSYISVYHATCFGD